MSDQLKLDLEAASQPPIGEAANVQEPSLTIEQVESLRVIGAPVVAHETGRPTRVGAFIVERGSLPPHVHFGGWKDDA